MAFYLVLSLAATAGLFFLAGADFVGAMQILIYVGGTLVLLVFGVMLTSQDRFISMKTQPVRDGHGRRWSARACSSLLVWAARERAGMARPDRASRWRRFRCEPTATPVGMGLLGVRVDADRPIASGYLLIFEIISVHLLVVLIGAAYLARAKREEGAVQSLE